MAGPTHNPPPILAIEGVGLGPTPNMPSSTNRLVGGCVNQFSPSTPKAVALDQTNLCPDTTLGTVYSVKCEANWISWYRECS